MKGYIHSIESFGTVDGPGVRFVVFFQGCPMRCLYCHNPDTWKTTGGKEVSVAEIADEFQSYKPFLKNGGITCTGGEPLMQIDFVIELFEEIKRRDGSHTCIDTCGATFDPEDEKLLEKFDRLLEVTDLFMLDIKHIDPKGHQKLTGHKIDRILAFANYLKEKKKEVWIRHVVVPTITYNKDYLYRLGYFLGAMKNMKALDVLPYHVMGKSKYESMGMDYPLKHLEALTIEQAKISKDVIFEGIKARLLDEKSGRPIRALDTLFYSEKV